MRKVLGGLVIAALILVALPLAASAQYREFSGQVDKINDKKITVDNRMGDKVTFVQVDATAVSGVRASWDDIEKKDWVTVSWKIADKPRKAYKIVTAEPKD